MKMAEIQTWLLNHVEKVVLGGVGLLIVVFLYMGYSQEGLNSDPAALKAEVARSKEHIDRKTWAEEAPFRLPEPDNTDADKDTTPVDARWYAIDNPLSKPPVSPRILRPDPKIYSPINLEAHAGSGPVAYIKAAEGAPVGPKKRLSAKERRIERLKALGFKFDKDGKPIAPAGAPPGLDLNKVMLGSSSIPGHRPSNMVEARGLRFVAVTALVPNLKQREEYESTLKDATGYDFQRDAPRYIWYVVQRAEAMDPKAPVDWNSPTVKKFTSKSLQQATLNWDTVLDDPIPDKLFDSLLTSNGVPLMLREIDPVLMHSKVEREKLIEDVVPLAPVDKGIRDPGIDGPDGPPLPGVNPGVGGPGRGGPGFNQNLGGERGGMRPPRGPGMEGMGGPGMAAGEPPPEHLLLRFYDTAVEPGKYYRYRVQLWLADVNDPYRGQVAAVGGNAAAPRLINEAWLDAEAAKRLKAKQAKDIKETPVGAMVPKHTYWRETEWSESTPPVILPREFHVLAGSVKSVKDLDRQRHMEPSGNSQVSIFDPSRAGDVSGEYVVSRGSQINFQTEGQLLDAVTLEIRKQPDYTFRTEHVVVDLHGGEPLPAWGKLAGTPADKSPIAPGEILMIDDRGNLRVQSEVEDFTDYDYYLYKPEAITKPKILNLPGGGNVNPPIGPGIGGERGGPVAPPQPFNFGQPGRGK